MNGIFLLLGSNVGNRLNNLRAAENHLIKKGIQVLDESSIYETAPWGKEDQAWFLNIILQVETSGSPAALLQHVLLVEQNLGRIRKEKWGERIIDVDILYYHSVKMHTEELIIPHPGIPKRRFTLLPLVEMHPLERHPITGKTQTEMLAECTDPLDCRITDYQL